MNYADMSDFDVNKAVFLKLKIEYDDIDFNPFQEYSSSLSYGDGANWNEFDSCNNPSDAWPIIVENGICITSPAMDGERWRAIIYTDTENYSWSDKNPLRAAMIVFLMINNMESKEYEIWYEGFATMESTSGAQLLGKVYQTSFKSAVIEFFESHGQSVNKYFDEKNMQFYGCKLFDNEVDARKTFG